MTIVFVCLLVLQLPLSPPPPGGVALPYMSYIGMCRCEGYGFKAVLSGIGYKNHRVLVYNRVQFAGKLISGMKN